MKFKVKKKKIFFKLLKKKIKLGNRIDKFSVCVDIKDVNESHFLIINRQNN